MPSQQHTRQIPNRLCLFLVIEADQREISEPSTPPETLESRLRHQLDLRLVATAAGAKATSNEISAPIDGSGICSSVGDDDGNGNDVNAMHRTEKS